MSNQQDFEDLIARIEAATETLEADVTLINGGTSSIQDLVDQAEQAVLDAQAQANLAANQVTLAADQASISEGHADDAETAYQNALQLVQDLEAAVILQEAPMDGQQYARQDGGWSVVTGGGGGGPTFTTVGTNIAEMSDPSAVGFIRTNADNTVSARTASQTRDDLGVQYGSTAGTVAQGNDSRLSNAREWTATTVEQAEAETGTATTRRAWTAQRVRQAIVAWWGTIGTAVGKNILSLTNPGAIRFLRINADNSVTARSDSEMRTDLGLGSVATSTQVTGTGDTTPSSIPTVEWVGANSGGNAPIWDVNIQATLVPFRNDILEYMDDTKDFDDMVDDLIALGLQHGVKFFRRSFNLQPGTTCPWDAAASVNLELGISRNNTGAITQFVVIAQEVSGNNIGRTWQSYRSNNTPRAWVEL